MDNSSLVPCSLSCRGLCKRGGGEATMILPVYYSQEILTKNCFCSGFSKSNAISVYISPEVGLMEKKLEVSSPRVYMICPPPTAVT